MPTTITLRSVKGSGLTNNEIDSNFANLKATADAALPLAGGTLAGALNGTAASFSGNISSGGTVSGTALAGPLNGTATNDDAAAGKVGEYVESVVQAASALALTTNVALNVTSISLTPGDWDVSGIVGFKSAATTSITMMRGNHNTTSATVDEMKGFYQVQQANVPTAVNQTRTLQTDRISLAATTTVYLVAQATFTVAALSAFGRISARRAR